MDDRFVNPYTFVPLPKGGAKRSDCTAVTEPVFSGEIKCRLTTKTQIAVPDILKNPVPDNVERTEPKENTTSSRLTEKRLSPAAAYAELSAAYTRC